MHIQCPKCNTIFDYSPLDYTNNKFKCSVCNHIWKEDISLSKNLENKVKDAALKKILYLNILVFLLAIITFFMFRNYLENIDHYWRNIFLFFDNLIPV